MPDMDGRSHLREHVSQLDELRVYSLEKILEPVQPGEFFSVHFERDWLHVRRPDESFFSSLLTIDDIDRLLSTNSFRTSDIFVVNHRSPVSIGEFASGSGVIDVQRVYDLYDRGATIILNRMNYYHPPFTHLCLSLEEEVGATCGANIYLTPLGAQQGFGAHFDTHDVIILQIHGDKRWRLYGTPIKDPLPGHGFEGKRDDPGEVKEEIHLRAGESLYIPRGVVHDAISTNETSLHATIGIFGFTWADLLLETLADAVLNDPEFRKPLPRRVMTGDGVSPEIYSEFQRLLMHFETHGRPQAGLDSLREQFHRRQRHELRGCLNQIEARRARKVARLGTER